MRTAEIAANMIEDAWERAGRSRWFVYMGLCQDEGPIYVKVGMSMRPDRRLVAIRCACPIPVRQFYICEIGSKQRARIVEKALHIAMHSWAVTGEWFRVSLEDKPEFNDRWLSVFGQHSTKGRKLKWERALISPVKVSEAGARAWALKKTVDACLGSRDLLKTLP